MKYLTAIALVAASAALPAQAATIYSNPLLSGPIATPGSVSFSANSAVMQTGFLSFNLDGFGSLDGVNAFQDDFDLTVNGFQLLSLSYDLGGGGSNVVFANPNGATIAGGSAGFFNGGQLQITVPLVLLAGANSFVFSYASPGPANGGGQGTGDEAWGVSDVVLTAGMGAIPETGTWTMMIVGFGAAGGALRYRRRKTTVTYA